MSLHALSIALAAPLPANQKLVFILTTEAMVGECECTTQHPCEDDWLLNAMSYQDIASSLETLIEHRWLVMSANANGQIVFGLGERAILSSPLLRHQASGQIVVDATPTREFYVKAVIPDTLRWEVFERDDFRCKRCGSRRRLAVDHIVPESKGGTLDLANLQTLCKPCNSRKGTRLES